MSTQIFRSDKDSVLVIHEPGNMTRYVGTAHKIQDGPVGYKNHWVVSFPQGGGSYILEEGMHLHWSYVMEKFALRMSGIRQTKACISEMTKMIGMMVPNIKVTTCTDDTGHLLDSEILKDAREVA